MKFKLLALGLISSLVLSIASVNTSSAAHVDPVFVSGNPTCEGLGFGNFEFKVDPVTAGTHTQVSTGFEVDITLNNPAAGQTFDWESNYDVNAVVAKGGPNANLYVYNPAETADDGLHSPANSSGNWANLSHISFCFDINLQVEKTANPAFDRDWSWEIDKEADQTGLTLADGQLFTVNYVVAVDPTSQDSNYAVGGDITIHNPHPTLSANITSVSDVITPGSILADVDCGVTFPHVLASGATLNCTYEATGLDGSEDLNTVTVNTTGTIGGGSATAEIDWAEALVSETDECVDVSDTNVGVLGQVCADDVVKTFEYSLDFGKHPDADVQLVCGENIHENIASFITNDTSATGEDDWTVVATVECEAGCSLTQGYWKTHNISFRGGAPADDAWGNLGLLAEGTAFFNSGKTWFEVFWTPPAGNPYYQLAHQYMAAKLNTLNGATPTPEVLNAIADAEALFNSPAYNTPEKIAALKGKNGNAVKAQFVGIAGILGSYNEGLTGPGHCSE